MKPFWLTINWLFRPTVEPPTIKPTVNFAERIVMNALGQDWVRETSKNQGEGIEKYWDATDYRDGYKNREPYCAAGVCWAIREGAEEAGIKETPGFRLPRTARAYGLEEWSLAQDASTQTKKHPRGDIQRGDIVVFNFSHVGIATGHPDRSGRFPTIEFNTGSGGGTSNEGDGVFRKHRSIDLVRSRIRFTV